MPNNKFVESKPKTPETAAVEIIEILDQTPVCLKCNSKMTQRTAEKGAREGKVFYGCSQFPKCRGVINTD